MRWRIACATVTMTHLLAAFWNLRWICAFNGVFFRKKGHLTTWLFLSVYPLSTLSTTSVLNKLGGLIYDDLRTLQFWSHHKMFARLLLTAWIPPVLPFQCPPVLFCFCYFLMLTYLHTCKKDALWDLMSGDPSVHLYICPPTCSHVHSLQLI